MKSTKNYIAFIDLLGMSDLAQHEPENYYRNLSDFSQTICNYSVELHGTGHIYLFSDCAYAESTNIDKLIEFLRVVRSNLLASQIYLKGAVGIGRLDPKVANEIAPVKDAKTRVAREETLYAHFFGQDVVKIFSLEQRLKGIGIRIDNSLADELSKKNYFVTSCYFPQSNSRIAECYLDLKLTEDELSPDILKFFLKNFLKSFTKSKSLGRYYLTFLITWINSVDASRVTSVPEDRSPIKAFLSTKFEKSFKDLVGIECLYYALINKLYADDAEPALLSMVEKFIGRRKALVKRLESTPDNIMPSRSKLRFIESLTQDFQPIDD